MTHLSDVTNGASLEDCHTNFFALADLCGIKWKKLSTNNVPCFDPLEDPVLLSYSKCLSAGILSVWRRIISQKTSFHPHTALGEAQQHPHGKELWIFWYGEEPDLTGLVEPNLLDVEWGSWESGLSYECRTLLFKALHNSIEKCLLSKGFSRFSNFFVKPRCYSYKDVSIRSQTAFAFKFFVHGESTVCLSVDMRVAPSVYHIKRCHLNAAQSGQGNVKVILGPYGMEGTLTGKTFRLNNVEITKLLDEWNRFYPQFQRNKKGLEDNDLPVAVEVLVAGVRLKYPTTYVFVVDDSKPVPSDQGKSNPSASSSFASPFSATVKQCPSLSILTPPMSPEENVENIENVYKSVGTKSTPSQNFCAFCGNEKSHPPPSIVKLSAMEETCISHHQEGTDDTPLWNVQDPSSVLKCACSRKRAWPSSSKFHTLECGPASSHRKNDKVQNSVKGVPFHKRKWNSEKVTDNLLSTTVRNSFPTSGSGSSVGNQVKNSNAVSSAVPAVLINLPQLHTPLTQPSSVDSHSNIPSVETSCSQICSSDPIMPTLSPHPPALKDEDVATIPEHNLSYTHSPSVDIGATINIKEKTATNELLSSLHASLLTDFENAKNAENLISHGKAAVEFAEGNPSTTKLQCPTLKKPLLKEKFDFEEDKLLMQNIFYDYAEDNQYFSGFNFPKRKCIRTYNFADENSNEAASNIVGHDGENSVSGTEISRAADDPYEFKEFEDADPCEVFRSHVDMFVKEEEKVPSPYPPSSPEIISPHLLKPLPPTLQEKNIKICDLPIPTPSPPNSKNIHSKFIREEDLVVTPNDLDNIFDTSSSDSDEEFPSTPNKFSSHNDEQNAKSKGSNLPTGLLELSRMFPTPPSLEHNAANSPLGTVGGLENVTSDDAAKDRELTEFFSSFSNWDPKDLDTVWRFNQFQMHVESPKYAPLPNLPSAINPIFLPEEMYYKPTWLQRSKNFPSNSNIIISNVMSERQMIFNQSNRCSSFEEEQSFGMTYPMEQNSEQRFVLMTGNLKSPLINMLPYANRHLNTPEDVRMVPMIPEAHSLYVNLVLSDSMLNIFKDHNFDSCSLCVCNMNIKGSDVGINLPNSLLPFRSDEPQYKCTCGFSAITYRHGSYCSGLFIEDEFDILGFRMEDIVSSKYNSEPISHPRNELKRSNFPSIDHQVPPPHMLDLIHIQCKSLSSSFSLFCKPDLCTHLDVPLQSNALEIHDRCQVCFLALEIGHNLLDNVMIGKIDSSLKSTCLHKWPYSSYPLPSRSQEVLQFMNNLKPMLQEAVHKRNTQRLWEVTYVISGPLTWREFHSLAARGNEYQCEPQPIPSVTVGHNKDLLSLSPFALKYWDKLLLEPYSLPRDVAYIVVSPENDFIISSVQSFFRELTSVYELYRMGRHSPITKVLRDGILRVGKKAADKLADEPEDNWFNQIGDTLVSKKLKLYAQVCEHYLVPHLKELTLDKSLIESNYAFKSNEKNTGVLSTKPPTPDTGDQSTKPTEQADNFQESSNAASGHNNNVNMAELNDAEDSEPPALVIYIVEPFTLGSVDPNIYRLVTLGLLQCYSQMLRCLDEPIRNSISLQLLSLNSILCMNGNDEVKKTDELKALAFSVFSQCHRILPQQLSVKSLTGFGPAAAQELFLSSRKERIFSPFKVYNQPLILACQKDKQTELGEMFGDRQAKFSILYCSYCLTEDRKWLIAGCTDDKGEMTDTIVINIAAPNRSKKKCIAVRRIGLRKLMDFILHVLSTSATPWRIIIGRLGRLGHGELRDWAGLLSRKSLLTYSQHLRELCKQCSGLGPCDSPSILSACLISVEPDAVLRIMPDQFSSQARLKSGIQCTLSTPEDASCTHILVFPTSATMQSSQASFHQDQNDETNLFGELIEEEMNDPEFNDLLQWTDIPSQIQSHSPHHNSVSQPASPSANSCHSPFHPGGPNPGMTVPLESQDDTLPLLQQPLALGYYVSTAKAGPLPKWFWSSCPHLANSSPTFLKFALLIHLPSIHSPDDILHTNAPQHNGHPLDSPFTTDVLRYVLEGYNALSWLSLDPNSYDRKSCLPVHIQILMQLYNFVENLL